MKKFLLILTAILTISAIGIAGCTGSNGENTNGTQQSRTIDTVQDENQDNCPDGDCDDNQPETPDNNKGSRCPRKRAPESSENRQRTSDAATDENDGDEQLPPSPDFHKPHRKHKDIPAPIPRRNPLQPR